MWWRRLRYVLLLAALCSIATCPAAKRACTAKARTREADELAKYLADRVAAQVAATGRVPAEAAGPTPTTSCCDQGGECAPDPSLWKTPAWQALAFSVDDEHRFSYSYEPDPSGRFAIVRAVGDVDCDGVLATTEVEIRIDGEGVKRSWTRQNRNE
ncbi:MAG TPA: hypothetical protein VIU61_06665 [Kofleriaceae bacterium]